LNPNCIAQASVTVDDRHQDPTSLMVAAFPRRDMSRRSKAQSCLRTPKLWLWSFLRVLRFLLCLKIGSWCRSSTVTLVKNMKITKRTQFKNRAIRQAHQFRMTT
jgi:hypothetical protein